MNLFRNKVKLRGFLGKEPDVPTSNRITQDAYAVLLLATVSGLWDLTTNQWTPRIDWHRIICPGAYFYGFTRGMRRGDYVEVEGDLRSQNGKQTVVVAGEHFPITKTVYAVHATHIHRLDRPLALVDTGDEESCP
jgi:hypothetical protein